MTTYTDSSQTIRKLRITATESHVVGSGGVTRIEAVSRPGLHCDIPYLAVWSDDRLIADYCRHHVLGVVYEHPST
jgi:hypothetical protein